MKKSWHPLLKKNQEEVWKAENAAREEKKRIEQKRKEIAEERQVQELQRLQEAQGGKPRQERLDWMYTAPGAGGQGVSESMEQYLLGKRKVDDLIRGDENEKLKKGAEVGFIAVQNANSVNDVRNKIMNDPLLAIRKQEQRQLEEILKNPVKMKEMRMKMEKMNRKTKKEDEDERRHNSHSHSHRHRHRDDKERSERRHRLRDGERSERKNGEDRDDKYERKHRDRDQDYHSEKRRRDRDDDYERSPKSRRYDDTRRNDRHPRPHLKQEHDEGKRVSDHRRHDRPEHSSRPRSPPIKRDTRSPGSPPPSSLSEEAARAAALQEMMANAEELESSRTTRLAALEAKEKADLEREELERMRKHQLGGRAGFMRDMQGRILEEGRRSMVR